MAPQRISASSLKKEEHHRGSVLVVRRIGPIAQTRARLLAALEDENGHTIILTFYHQKRNVSAEEFLPKGAVLAVKEPYLHLDSLQVSSTDNEADTACYVVRVDHPSDIIVLPFSDPLVPSKFFLETIISTAAAWKDAGNSSFKNKRFLDANRWYVSRCSIIF